MSDCCNEFTRSHLLRNAAAEAGKGLPAIETGMPTPAGTGLTRRSFLSRSAGMALAVYGASKLPLSAFEDGIAAAATSDRTLVSVFFDGGIDALSVLSPVGDPLYQRLRPTLAQPAASGTPFSEDPRLNWHPAATKLATLHGEGKVTVFPAIGYSGADQSHFTSRHFWEIGEVEVGQTTGWLGRYIDVTGEEGNPLQGLSLDGVLSPMLASAERPVAAIDNVGKFDLPSPLEDPVKAGMFRTFESFGSLPSDSPGLAQVRSAIAQTANLRRDLSAFEGFRSPVRYPDSTFARRLAGLAAMLGMGLPIRAVTIHASGGYDTHNSQAGRFAQNLRATVDGLYAFQRDLEARGIADRVLTQAWSEFGRRPRENGSRGTDHGAAGCAFVVGTQAKGQMVGEFPGLASLDEDDNLRSTSDFRSMYCSLLEQWYGQDATPIIPGASGFARPQLVR